MVLRRSGRIMTIIVILFFSLSEPVYPQCKREFTIKRTFTVEGISTNPDSYYQNLIVQDLAIAGQKKFAEIILNFDYFLTCSVDQCLAGNIDILVNNLNVDCSPVYYQDFDICQSLKPFSADLVFTFRNENSITFDSLVFYNVKVDDNPDLYTQLTYKISQPGRVEVSLSRAVFHFTKKSYEKFRDRILVIDNYFAANALADSLFGWTSNGFLAENDTIPYMLLNQTELNRVLKNINPERFASVIPDGQKDILELGKKYKALSALNYRYNSIVFFNHHARPGPGFTKVRNKLMETSFDHYDYYYQLSFRTDFRFTNFLNNLSIPSFTNASLLNLSAKLSRLTELERMNRKDLEKWFAKGLLERGNRYEGENNQLRALVYYKSALQLSQLLHLDEMSKRAEQASERMISEISYSYIEIAKTGALRDNPKIAAQYFNDARAMFSDTTLNISEPLWLLDYEKQLYSGFETKVQQYLEQGDFQKSMAYLTEIQDHCISNPGFPYPLKFHEWMKQARGGIYLQLLARATGLLKLDEVQESENVYRQAVEMRSNIVYTIEKDIAETKLEVAFKQLHYDEFFEEGYSHYQKLEYISSLYYFNKADYLEKSGGVSHMQPSLSQYRQNAARQVMLDLLSEGRLKTWAHDFNAAGTTIEQVGTMLADYNFPKDDTVSIAYNNLKDNVLRTECDHVLEQYNHLLAQMADTERSGDYITAYDLSKDAVNLSMENIKCRIPDEEAWYQKIRLEGLAGYQQKEKNLDMLMQKPVEEYLSAFQELKKYYYRNKLLEEGVRFVPLSERILSQTDPVFLTAMLDHYLYLRDLDQSVKILQRIKLLQLDPGLYKSRQQKLGRAVAFRDASNNASERPWELLSTYTDHDKWFRAFSWSYKRSWLKTSGWKLKFWPFIWKK